MPACHAAPPLRLGDVDVRVALAGNPNVGKSSLFNALTGSRALVANYPGKTVELEWGLAEADGRRAAVVDLPGCYDLDGASEDQRVAADVILRRDVDAVLVVLDATNLARNLFLGLRVAGTGVPVAYALNLVDEAEARGKHVDAAILSEALRAPVVRTVASRGEGARDALRAALSVATRGGAALEIPSDAPALHRLARQIAARATTLSGEARAESRLWRLTTTPATGLPILAATLLAIFSFVYFVGGVLSTAFSNAWTAAVSPILRGASFAVLGDTAVARIALWGFDSGVNATLAVGIPYVLAFYAILAVLEDSGYLNAAAVLTHRSLSRLGLHGRAIIPLVSGAGCNVPAIIGTRVLASRRERFVACTLVSLMPCSARTAVIFGAVGLFLGPLPALAIFGTSLAVILATGLALNRFMPGKPPAFLLELFPFRRPNARGVAFKTWHRFKHFTFAAVPVVILGSLVLGALYETGLVWSLAGPLDPVVGGLLGLPAVAGLALVFAFLRKELALQLLLALAIMQYGAGAASLTYFLSPRQIFTYALVTTLYVPCIASVAALGRELGWRNAGIISGITVGWALALGGVVARLPMWG
jgi:ferrous iron transport protein B